MPVADYRPRPIIEAVNSLAPVGRSGALAMIDSYLRHHDAAAPHDGLALLLRVLFDVPPSGAHAPLRLGGTVPPPPPDPRALPRFPIILVDDVPLLLIRGYALGGDTEPVTVALDQLRRTGSLRAAPLVPHGTPDGIRRQLREVYRRAYGEEPTTELDGWITRQIEGVADLLGELRPR